MSQHRADLASQQSEENHCLYAKQMRASFQTAQDAEEGAHQLEMERINAACSASASAFNSYSQGNQHGFLPASVTLTGQASPDYLPNDPARPRTVSFSEATFARIDQQQIPPGPPGPE